MPIINNNFYVITGGPGTGKTSLINKLHSLKYDTVPEAAHEIIKEQIKIDGDALPWKNKKLYTCLMLEESIKNYRDKHNTSVPDKPVFFDRGIGDTFCYAEMIQMPLSKSAKSSMYNYRYNKNVFLLPPWKEIYHTDNERRQNWEEAVYTYNTMKRTYSKYGYNTIEIPRTTIDQRVAFILGHL